MNLTFNIKHNRVFTNELEKVGQVGEFVVVVAE